MRPRLRRRKPSPDSLRQELERIPRMLLIRLRSLGDSILTLPLLDALHGWRSDLQLDILIEAPYAPVFARHPAVHEALIVQARNQAAKAVLPRIRALTEIRKRRYPAVLNLHGGTTSIFFTLASGAGLRIGQENHRGSCFYTACIPPSAEIWQRESLHTAEHQLSLIRWLGIPLRGELACFLYVDEAARERVRDRLARENISHYFLIHPTATLSTKQWSARNFARLGDHLLKRHGFPVIYTAAPHEIEVLWEVRKEASEQHVYWADLPLEDLFALIEGCRLFVGNDSGPTHAASALKKPVVVVWGSSNFQAWRPWGTDYEAIRADLPCMPCPGYTCAAFGEPRCIQDITVAQVAEACEKILRREIR